MTAALFIVLELMTLHTLDGREILVNPAHIVSLVEARSEDDPQNVLHAKVHCVVNLLDAKFLSVEEQCDSIRQRLK